MKDKVEHFIINNSLFTRKDKLILAISGGPDSVCLLHILLDLSYKFDLAHCNFQLRGEESNEDENFVRKLAKQYNLRIHVKHFDTKAHSIKNKVSLQMAARDLRYSWFNDLLISKQASYIIVGHHANDAIETFFINLIRDSGIKGLLGIKSKRDKIVRPLIQISRKEIEGFLKEKRIDFREDSSNFSLKYLRNNIRHNLLPLIAQINPNINETISNKMNVLNDIYTVYSSEIETVRRKILKYKDDVIYFNIQSVLQLNPTRIYLYELLYPYGFSDIYSIEKSLNSQSGKQYFSSTHRLVIDRKYVFISILARDNHIFKIHKSTSILEKPIFINFSVEIKKKLFLNSEIAQLDFDKLLFPLTLRKWRDGDRFKPLGMNRFKKLSDFFIDNKFSIIEKTNQWLLCSGTDIVWIVGHRIDDRYKVDATTKKVYIATI